MQNNISGSSHNYKLSFNTASLKWTTMEDQKLRRAVEKYGTQWTLIMKRYRFNRSVNSIVKRWHGKLKDQAQNKSLVKQQSFQNDQEIQQMNDKSKRARKQQKKEQKRQQKKQEKKQQKKQQKKQLVKEEKRQTRDTHRSNRHRRSIDIREKQENQKVVKKEPKSDQQENLKAQSQQANSFSDLEEGKQYVFQYNWKESDDYMLKQSILTEKILNWDDLASKLRINDVKEVKKRWQKIIYPSIVESRKIGGCVKYSEEEDSILTRGVKIGMGINQLRRFLPGRTPYSLDARRRRTLRMEEKQVPELRFWTKRLSLHKFVQKRHEHLQKPADEQFFLYKSQSE